MIQSLWVGCVGAALSLFSRLPFFVLHRFSDISFVLVYFVFQYRRQVVRENLLNSFPEKSPKEIQKIEMQFYRNFCDLIFETIKTFSISPEELQSRCKLVTRSDYEAIRSQNKNITGISSHLGNWEWLSLDLGLQGGLEILAVYKPLSHLAFDRLIKKSRERFGTKMTAMKSVPTAIQQVYARPFLLGLLSDQAPHAYDRAFEVRFLNQKTYVVSGPGVLTVKNNWIPIWGWVKRVGRSRYEWGVKEIHVSAVAPLADLPDSWSDSDRLQCERISKVYNITLSKAYQALKITESYCEQLEQQIIMAPQDWLWSHRRWKKR